jgi:hypothetical protein
MAAPINPSEDNSNCLASFRRGRSESRVFLISTGLALRGGGRVLLRLSITEARNLGRVLTEAAEETAPTEADERMPA